MTKLLSFLILITLVSCGNPSSDRPNFTTTGGGTGGRDSNDNDNSRLTATCSVVSTKGGSFMESVNNSNPSLTRELKSSFSDTRILVEEYVMDFKKLNLKMKAYLVSKDDKTVLSVDPDIILIGLNDKKIVNYSYDDEKSFGVSINCSTNQPIEVPAELK